eukprot:7398005-Pyramimonas_sp.AAC.2
MVVRKERSEALGVRISPGGISAGRRVRLTAKGLRVSALHLRISARRSSGVFCVSAVMVPSPPASDTAAALAAYPRGSLSDRVVVRNLWSCHLRMCMHTCTRARLLQCRCVEL